MPKKELKPAMERVNEMKAKAKAESSTATLEVSEGWDALTGPQGSETLTVGKVEQLTDQIFTLPPWSETLGKLYGVINGLGETQGQNTIRILQELKGLKERLDTIESVLTKLVIQSTVKPTNGGTKAPAPEVKEETKELEPYTNAVEEVRKGLRGARSQGNPRFKFDGNGPTIIAILSKKGFSIPNTEEFKTVLRSTPGFTYSSVDNTFSYDGE